ncbi:MAG TPA: tetratricopeptide repeat protein [Acidobacteriota bacterium]
MMIKRPAVLVFGLLGLMLVSCSGPKPLSQLRIGIWAAQRDLWEEAVFRWAKVLQADPNSAAAHNNLAVAYEKKGMLAEARQEYELALKLAPQNTYIKANFERFKASLESKEDKPGQAKPEKEKKTHELF